MKFTPLTLSQIFNFVIWTDVRLWHKQKDSMWHGAGSHGEPTKDKNDNLNKNIFACLYLWTFSTSTCYFLRMNKKKYLQLLFILMNWNLLFKNKRFYDLCSFPDHVFFYWKLICFFLFSKQRVTHGIVGYALCFYTYSTWQGRTLFLEDLYVKPNYRTHGIGKLIFTEVAKFAKSMNCKRLELHVLDWNPARFFYDKLGGVDLTNLEGWNYYRFNQQAIESLANDNN